VSADAWTGGWTATGRAADVRAGRVAPDEPTREALRRIAERDGPLGAFVRVRAQAARREAAALADRADLADLPLAGVPVAIKDNVAVAGEPLRIGSLATSAEPQAADHPVVARLRAAGAVVVGVTAVPELCIFGSTDTPYRTTRNPWNTSRSPGGSSGGSAAAVAAGMVPIAHAADGMGSIRIPAACCGLVGLKPGPGVVPAQLGVDSWGGIAENGCLATTVDDLALTMAVLAGRRIEPDPAGGPRTVAVALHSPVPWLRTTPRWLDAGHRVARLLADLGHRTEPARLPYPVLPPITRWLGGPADDARGLDRARLQRRTRTHMAAARVMHRLYPVRDGQADAAERRVRNAIGDADVVLTPSLAHDPPPATPRSRAGWLANMTADVRFSPYTSIWNVLRWPAMTVPAGRDPISGLPVTVQLAARPGGEGTLLELAAQIERHAPWPGVAPF
jgi:amidase